MRDGLVNFQTKVWRRVRLVWPLVSHVYLYMHGTDSIYRTLIASNIYLLHPLAVARYDRALLIIARVQTRDFTCRFTTRLLIPYILGILAVHAVCIHISLVHKNQWCLPPKRRYPGRYKLVAHRGSPPRARQSAHPPAERRDRKNSNFACAADKTASSYI